MATKFKVFYINYSPLFPFYKAKSSIIFINKIYVHYCTISVIRTHFLDLFQIPQ